MHLIFVMTHHRQNFSYRIFHTLRYLIKCYFGIAALHWIQELIIITLLKLRCSDTPLRVPYLSWTPRSSWVLEWKRTGAQPTYVGFSNYHTSLGVSVIPSSVFHMRVSCSTMEHLVSPPQKLYIILYYTVNNLIHHVFSKK